MRRRLAISIILLIVTTGFFHLYGQEAKGVEKVVSPFTSSDIKLEMTNQWALIIGINEYNYITGLNNAVYDSTSIKSLLIDKYGYEKEKVTTLDNAKATTDAITRQLELYQEKLKPRDNLFIYYSGHGYVKNDIGYWLPCDVGMDKREESESIKNKKEFREDEKNQKIINTSKWKIHYYDIVNFLENCKAKHVFLVMDSCYSARIFQEFAHKSPVPSTHSLQERSRQILASGRGIVPDGIRGEHSPFANFFIGFLEGNDNPFFSASTLIARAKENQSLSAEGGYIIWQHNKGGEFYFFLKDAYFDSLIQMRDNYDKLIEFLITGKANTLEKRKRCLEFLKKFENLQRSNEVEVMINEINKYIKEFEKTLNSPVEETIPKNEIESVENIDKSNIIVKDKKKKKFPTLLLAAGGVTLGIVLYLILKKKPKPTTNPMFLASSENITVPEGGTATFNVSLSAKPSPDVSVSVARVNGDEDIIVQSGSSLTFTSSNWSQPQTVTLAANEDADIANGTATIRISGNNISNKDITAAEQDNDSIQFITDTESVTVPEGSTASFNVKLSNQPNSDIPVTVTRESGDSDITVESGQILTFTTSNWNAYQTVTLRAANDSDTVYGQATIRLSAPGVPDKDITAIEDDDDRGGCTISVSITSPANDATVSGTVTIRASVSGTCLIDRVEFFVDNTVIHADTTSPYTASWNTAKEFEGAHNIRVVAYSTTGKTASANITVTVTR